MVNHRGYAQTKRCYLQLLSWTVSRYHGNIYIEKTITFLHDEPHSTNGCDQHVNNVVILLTGRVRYDRISSFPNTSLSTFNGWSVSTLLLSYQIHSSATSFRIIFSLISLPWYILKFVIQHFHTTQLCYKVTKSSWSWASLNSFATRYIDLFGSKKFP